MVFFTRRCIFPSLLICNASLLFSSLTASKQSQLVLAAEWYVNENYKPHQCMKTASLEIKTKQINLNELAKICFLLTEIVLFLVVLCTDVAVCKCNITPAINYTYTS